MSKLLFNKKPLVIDVELATHIGLNESILLQQIHYWIVINKESMKNFEDGFYWTYNTYEKWQEQFPFWSLSTIKRIITKLEKIKILISANYNRLGIDRTKWYRIDYKVLEILAGQPLDEIVQPLGQNDPMQEVNLTRPLPEITTEITTNNKTSMPNSNESDEKVAIPYLKIKDLFNEICQSFSKIKSITDKRKPHIKARWVQLNCDIEEFKTAFTKIEASNFCKGGGPQKWWASFDWLMANDSNIVKVIEGKYDNKESGIYGQHQGMGGKNNSGKHEESDIEKEIWAKWGH